MINNTKIETHLFDTLKLAFDSYKKIVGDSAFMLDCDSKKLSSHLDTLQGMANAFNNWSISIKTVVDLKQLEDEKQSKKNNISNLPARTEVKA